MIRSSKRALTAGALALTLGIAGLLTPAPVSNAADHFDAPLVSNDQTADIADVFAFIDPVDNTKLDLILTVNGFIVPQEAVNAAAFDPAVTYRFNLELNGGMDAKTDRTIDVTFSRRTDTTVPQTATIRFSSGENFTAPTTPPNLSATAPTRTITTDTATGISFFAGLSDDPFFFDIPAFNRFVASLRAGTPDPTVFQRGRDSFAGYNVKAIALSIPLSRFGTLANNEIGVWASTLKGKKASFKSGVFTFSGKLQQLDRMGNPAVNVALIPFARKDAYNFATPEQDAAFAFIPELGASLTLFGTTNMDARNTLLAVGVARGDMLRVRTNVPNTGPGGGTNAEAAFPNGRRLGDDTIDTINFLLANLTPLPDNVDSNDVPLTDTFPYLGLSQQPRDPGQDDSTRN